MDNILVCVGGFIFGLVTWSMFDAGVLGLIREFESQAQEIEFKKFVAKKLEEKHYLQAAWLMTRMVVMGRKGPNGW